MTWEVIEGDCLRVLPTIPDGAFDAVITDPPYGIAFQSNQRVATEKFARIANDDAPFVWWAYDAARVLKDGGVCLCFCRWDVAEAFRSALEWAGLKVPAQIVWDKEVHGMGDLTGAPAPCHETIWFATKGRYQLPGRRPVTVVRHARVSSAAITHPNEKPIGLMLELVEDYVPLGGRVLDPFAGSGSTGAACVMQGRDFLGVELDPKHAAAARRRIADSVPLGVAA